MTLTLFDGLRRSGVANIKVADVNLTQKPQKRARGKPLPARILETTNKGQASAGPSRITTSPSPVCTLP